MSLSSVLLQVASRNPPVVPVEKIGHSGEEQRATNPERVLLETIRVAASYDARAPFHGEDMGKKGHGIRRPPKSATVIEVVAGECYVEVV